MKKSTKNKPTTKKSTKKRSTKKKLPISPLNAKARSGSRQETIVTQLVQRENERLTRLLRNLYQEFRLGQGDRSQLYEHICRELAQYFHCDCCQLYLIKQQALDPVVLRRAKPSTKRAEPPTKEVLSLVAAFGPWEAALKPRYVRRIIPIEYPLDSNSHTALRFREGVARVDLSRVDYRISKRDVPPRKSRSCRSGRDPPPKQDSPPEPEWHVVWPRDNLYNVSRNVISCPILRHRSRARWEPYPIGLIKLENRRPFNSTAFEFNYEAGELYFGAYFELCSIAGYVRDLRNRLSYADSIASLSSPLHDGDGWRQHYQVHQSGEPYYQIVLAWHKEVLAAYKKRREEDAHQSAKIFLESAKIFLEQQYDDVSEKLSAILDLVVEAEVLLQALRVVLKELRRTTNSRETKSQPQNSDWADTPIPSFFNVIDLVKAETRTWTQLKQVRTAIYSALKDAFKKACETSDPQHAEQACKALAEPCSRPRSEGQQSGSVEIRRSCETFDPQQAEKACKALAEAYCKPKSEGKKNGSAGTDQLWNRLVAKFEEKKPSLLGLLEKGRQKELAENMHGFILNAAQLIREQWPPTGAADLAPEVLSCYQCAQGVLDVVQLELKTQTDSKLLPHPPNTKTILELFVRRFAAAQAKACQYAHTFDPQIDEARLYSIQSHVSQIIDNHLMEKMRDLGISFDHLELLGLTDSSVEQLELLDKLLQDAARCQEMAVRRYLASLPHGGGTTIKQYIVEARPHSIRDILDELVNPMRGKRVRSKRVPTVFPVQLFEVNLRPKNLQNRSKECRAIETKIRAKLGSRPFGDPLKPKFIVTTGDLFQHEAAKARTNTLRPVPKWLFTLNDELVKFCQITKAPLGVS